MKRAIAELLWISVVTAVLGSVCWGGEAEAPPAPSVVAHFHLSGMVTEAPMVDPFGFMAGQVTSLKDLVRRIDQASTDDEVEAVVLTYDSLYFGFGQLEEIRETLRDNVNNNHVLSLSLLLGQGIKEVIDEVSGR